MAKNPQILENYEIGDLIGKGRFAEVFRAVKRDLGREVALKILLPAWNENAAVRSQFMEQAKLIARLKHPRIVEAMDLGEENGRLFMAMEYLPKGDLHQWLQSFGKKRPSLLQVVILVEDIAKALDFIHSQTESGETLVHGDVKPGNILLTEERDTPGRLRAKLSDLGLLTVLQKAASMSGSSAFPQSSPLYISPEQADDNSPTPFSDQYALGVVTYELLTGQPPFVGGSNVTIYRHHKQTQPQPPSAHVSQLQREIDEVLLKVLAKDPAMRYPNCASYARALRQAVEIAEQKRFADLLTQAREALSEGQPEKALPALEEARQIKPDDSEVKNLFDQAQKTALATRNYQEAGELLESTRAEAQRLRAEAPNYSDSQKLLATFAPRQLVWWEVLLNQWKRALWATGILLLLIFMGIIFQGKPWVATAANTPVFQTMVGNFWTASPTYTPTNTLTSTPTNTFTPTPTFTPTFTPSPIAFATTNATKIILLHRLEGLENAGDVVSIAFAPNSEYFAMGSSDGNVHVWLVDSWQQIKVLNVGSRVNSLDFSKNGGSLAVASDNNTVLIWDMNDLDLSPLKIQNEEPVYTVSFSLNGQLAVGGANVIRVWSINGTHTVEVKTLNVSGMVRKVNFSPNGKKLVTVMDRPVSNGYWSSFISIYNASNWEESQISIPSLPIPVNAISVSSLQFSTDNLIIGTVRYHTPIGYSDFYSIIEWNAENRKIISDNDIRNSGVLVVSENVVSYSDNENIILSFGTFAVNTLTGHKGSISSLAFSPNGWWLASGSGNEVFLWGVPRWNTLGTPTLVPTPTITPTITFTPTINVP